MRIWLGWLFVLLIGVVLTRLVVDLVRLGPCPQCRGTLFVNPAGELHCMSCGYLAPSDRAGRLARWRLDRRRRRQERAVAEPTGVVRAGAERPEPVSDRELSPV